MTSSGAAICHMNSLLSQSFLLKLPQRLLLLLLLPQMILFVPFKSWTVSLAFLFLRLAAPHKDSGNRVFDRRRQLCDVAVISGTADLRTTAGKRRQGRWRQKKNEQLLRSIVTRGESECQSVLDFLDFVFRLAACKVAGFVGVCEQRGEEARICLPKRRGTTDGQTTKQDRGRKLNLQNGPPMCTHRSEVHQTNQPGCTKPPENEDGNRNTHRKLPLHTKTMCKTNPTQPTSTLRKFAATSGSKTEVPYRSTR